MRIRIFEGLFVIGLAMFWTACPSLVEEANKKKVINEERLLEKEKKEIEQKINKANFKTDKEYRNEYKRLLEKYGDLQERKLTPLDTNTSMVF